MKRDGDVCVVVSRFFVRWSMLLNIKILQRTQTTQHAFIDLNTYVFEKMIGTYYIVPNIDSF